MLEKFELMDVSEEEIVIVIKLFIIIELFFEIDIVDVDKNYLFF